MKKETYIKMIDYMKNHIGVSRLIKILYTALPLVMLIAYPVIVIINALNGISYTFILSVVIPAVTLIGVKILRKLINKPRPYETFEHNSLIAKDKVGQSCPSNHAACGFVIAMTAFSVNAFLGAGLFIIALIITVTRVLAGVHFVSDVIIGSAIGLIMGSVFLFI